MQRSSKWLEILRIRALAAFGCLALVSLGLLDVGPGLYAQELPGTSDDVQEPSWERLYGPPGGYVGAVAFDPFDPTRLYAVGTDEGLYRTIDSGRRWQLLPFPPEFSGISDLILVDPERPGVLYVGIHGLSKSTDYGVTWTRVVGETKGHINIMRAAMDPLSSNTLYASGRRHDSQTIAVFKSENGGENWLDITGNLATPVGATVMCILPLGDGRVLVSIRDEILEEWGNGRLYRTDNDGITWQEVEYGQREPRFVWSIVCNPANPDELWLSEGSVFNQSQAQPIMHKSLDGGKTWQPVFFDFGGFDSTGTFILKILAQGQVLISSGGALYSTEDGGITYKNISPPGDSLPTTGGDVGIAIHPSKPEIMFYPLRFTGIAYTEDGGRTWQPRHNGISTTSLLLLEADPSRPSTLYAVSQNISGVFFSEDYGSTWQFAPTTLSGDELDANPLSPGTLWTISDKPFIGVSHDFGRTWTMVSSPYRRDMFNQNSLYAIAQSSVSSPIYAANNGFGIYRGEVGSTTNDWWWQYSRTCEVDYTYALEVDPGNPDIVYSGYSRKPFQDYAMVRATYDGGESWFTSLRLDGCDAVTSISVNSSHPEQVLAASASVAGGAVWISADRGQSWTRANPLFSFTTIHSFDCSSDGHIYAGVWGGGTWWSSDEGRTWTMLGSEEAMSAAAIAVSPWEPRAVYIADRMSPCLYRTSDSGRTFELVFDAGSDFSRLMDVVVDPHEPDTFYVLAMGAISTSGVPYGAHGAVFKVANGAVENVTGSLPRMPLSLTVDLHRKETLYAVLHGEGVYRSIDGGDHWADISGSSNGLPDSGFLELVADPEVAGSIYLVGGCDVRFSTYETAGLDQNAVNGVYHSSDGGDSWRCLNSGPLGTESGAVKALALRPGDPGTIYVAAENGLFISWDRGETWQRDTSLPYSVLSGILLYGDSAIAFTNGAGVFRGAVMNEGSITWDPDPKCVVPVQFSQVLKDPGDLSTIYATAYPGGVFKSTDGGSTWHEANFGLPSFLVEDPLRQGYYALALAPSQPEVLYLGMYGKGVYLSRNAGGTWQPMNGRDGMLYGLPVTSVAVDPVDSNHVFVASEDGVYRSENGGVSWARANEGLLTLDVKVLDFSPTGILYAGTRGYGLFKWRVDKWVAQSPVANWGVTWPIWDDRPLYQYSDFLFHSEDPLLMLLGSFPVGIYRSEDAGASWRESNLGWTLDGVFCLVSHPNDADTVYAGTYNGINRSLDFGLHWTTWNLGMPPEQWVYHVDFDPTDPDIMYACSKNGENEGTGVEGFRGTVMKSIDGGQSWTEITNGLDRNQEFYHLIVDPVIGDTIYLATQNEGMMISRDAGETWGPWNEGLEGQMPGTNGNNVTRVLEMSTDGRFLYFGSYRAGLFRRELTRSGNGM